MADQTNGDAGALPQESVSAKNNEGGEQCEVRNSLKRAVIKRQASLTVGEKAFLHSLLIDAPLPIHEEADEKDGGELSHKDQMSRANEVLDDDVLFSLPFEDDGAERGDSSKRPAVIPPRSRRNQSNHIGLWKAHEDGIAPKLLKKKSSLSPMGDSSKYRRLKSKKSEEKEEDKKPQAAATEGDKDDTGSVDSIRSDEEVRGISKEHADNDEDVSSASSWDLSEGGFDHYDAWAVLKDEYAEDFGFSYRDDGPIIRDFDDSGAEHLFKIIGTSADDISAHPHVLSPPLMDSLLNFVPDSLAEQNFWLKFSLVRDGASLDILKRYVRAAPNTILAIETTNGEVFGSYTSSPWRNNPGYFGSGQSFLWKMRHSRMTPVHSLFEQAQMESEIDVYFYSGLNDYVQLCTSEKIAIGGGELDITGNEQHGDDVQGAPFVYLEEGEHYGFGLAVSEDLLHGTSSPCATFRNPCLVNHSSEGEVFEIVNLEIWTFTPCDEVAAAEKLEMTKFFVQESVLSSISSRSSTGGFASRVTSSAGHFSGSDLLQEDFYRRVGDGQDEDALDRAGWEYQSMMNPSGTSSGVRSPYFASNNASAGGMGMNSPHFT